MNLRCLLGRHADPVYHREDGRSMWLCLACTKTWPRTVAGTGTLRPERRNREVRQAEQADAAQRQAAAEAETAQILADRERRVEQMRGRRAQIRMVR